MGWSPSFAVWRVTSKPGAHWESSWNNPSERTVAVAAEMEERDTWKVKLIEWFGLDMRSREPYISNLGVVVPLILIGNSEWTCRIGCAHVCDNVRFVYFEVSRCGYLVPVTSPACDMSWVLFCLFVNLDSNTCCRGVLELHRNLLKALRMESGR